jgi:glycosyltransferase involved in cell wall biosynthesis
MATGAFPAVSDLPSQDGWIEHGVNGLRVPARNVEALTDALERALRDDDLRLRAAEQNRTRIEAEDVLEESMLRMEALYYRLAGKTPIGS